ncbi:MAG TPA: hypothetical protein VMK13_17805 [Streptosporangiaceae bacterium]|nr:hypothetical protein [Streptosporangiaceae bacterium]
MTEPAFAFALAPQAASIDESRTPPATAATVPRDRDRARRPGFGGGAGRRDLVWSSRPDAENPAITETCPSICLNRARIRSPLADPILL